MDNIESPCISVCRLNVENMLCEGCWRSVEEIRDWATLDRDQRLTVLENLHERRTAAGGRRRRQTSRRRQKPARSETT